MDIAFPYHLGPQGTTAIAASAGDHIAQLLEQLLFTRPGERVNRPGFGCGLLDLVFSPTSPEVAAALSITVSADRKSTRLNSSHPSISYAVFCLKKKKKKTLHYTSITYTQSEI